MTPDEPVRVRIVSNPVAPALAIAVILSAAAASFLIRRRRHYGPLVATRVARSMQRWAQTIEDAGLNLARPKESM